MLHRRQFLATALAAAVGACTQPKDPPALLQFSLPNQNDETVDTTHPGIAGKPLLMYLFGVWCAPCKQLTPAIQRLHETYADKGLAVAGVHFAVIGDSQEGYRATLQSYAEAMGVSFPLLVGGMTEQVGEALPTIGGVQGFPTTILFDGTGRQRQAWTGYHDSMDREMEEAVRALLVARSG